MGRWLGAPPRCLPDGQSARTEVVSRRLRWSDSRRPFPRPALSSGRSRNRELRTISWPENPLHRHAPAPAPPLRADAARAAPAKPLAARLAPTNRCGRRIKRPPHANVPPVPPTSAPPLRRQSPDVPAVTKNSKAGAPVGSATTRRSLRPAACPTAPAVAVQSRPATNAKAWAAAAAVISAAVTTSRSRAAKAPPTTRPMLPAPAAARGPPMSMSNLISRPRAAVADAPVTRIGNPFCPWPENPDPITIRAAIRTILRPAPPDAPRSRNGRKKTKACSHPATHGGSRRISW